MSYSSFSIGSVSASCHGNLVVFCLHYNPPMDTLYTTTLAALKACRLHCWIEPTMHQCALFMSWEGLLLLIVSLCVFISSSARDSAHYSPLLYAELGQAIAGIY